MGMLRQLYKNAFSVRQHGRAFLIFSDGVSYKAHPTKGTFSVGVLRGGILEKLRFTLSFLALVLAASFALSCGASQGPGQLHSITLSPAIADEKDYPNGVPFTATGIYIDPSHTVTPQSANWGACYQGAATDEVSVSAGGTAQCANGASGTYTVFAFDLPNPSCSAAINACGGGGCTIVGTAQVTCP
jgi:hypothetical protein